MQKWATAMDTLTGDDGSPIPILDIKDIFGGFTDDAFAGPAIEDLLALSGDFRTNACRRFGAWSALAVVGKHHDGDDGGGKKKIAEPLPMGAGGGSAIQQARVRRAMSVTNLRMVAASLTASIKATSP